MGSLSGDTGSNQYSELVLSYGGGAESPLMQMLMGEDIQPGTEPSYQLCKTIYIYHPLGGKMAEGPIKLAQSQERKVTIQGAPDEAVFWGTLKTMVEIQIGKVDQRDRGMKSGW